MSDIEIVNTYTKNTTKEIGNFAIATGNITNCPTIIPSLSADQTTEEQNLIVQSGGQQKTVSNRTSIAYIPEPYLGSGGSFPKPPIIYGCTDPRAMNYNPNARVNDGSCVYIIRGCTNPCASNYNPSANSDDGSCSCYYTGGGSSWFNPSVYINEKYIYISQETYNINGTSGFNNPPPALASYVESNKCRFLTRTITQTGPGCQITTTYSFTGGGNIIVTASGTINFTATIDGRPVTWSAYIIGSPYSGPAISYVNPYSWQFNVQCTNSLGQKFNVDFQQPIGVPQYTTDYTGMMPVGQGAYGNLIPSGPCATTGMQELVKGGTAVGTYSDSYCP